jgi:20S proteasome alpha/beta subunit
VLAAFDFKLGLSRVFSFYEDSSFHEAKFLAGAGCGFEAVKGLIIDRWEEGMDTSLAMELVVRAMLHSGISSCGVSDLRIVLPKIALIDQRGFRWVPERTVSGTRRKILRELRGKGGL